MAAELDPHLAQDIQTNRKNGSTKKRIKASTGGFELATPRDRNGTFEPQLVKKHQTTLSNEIEQKIIRLFALGMSYGDIRREIEEMYDADVSPSLISKVTDAVKEQVLAWQNRPLESLYPIVYLDCIVVKVRHEGSITNKSVFLALGINLDGHKELLGMWIAENEGAKFWLNVLTELKNRGLQDILIACIDGLKGFPDAINSVYPQTHIQLCIIHMVRNSLKYVA